MDEIKKLEMWIKDLEGDIEEELGKMESELDYINSLEMEEELGGFKYSLEWMLERVENVEELKRLKNNIESRKKVVG